MMGKRSIESFEVRSTTVGNDLIKDLWCHPYFSLEDVT
ncbi:hypothetical protein FOPG_16189 [Fusarium oxysporum f. sp. conglutinans race 2 54008]|uniref:Uncharacterized protein n=2 Tax=Fusarium oxysporum species complex TaxID=171631 RepID=X0J0Q3_FUSO5|nr:uncharacterized protein FOIG_16916 [Fusarium odoratissimum NRRL 54006]EXL67695.1 hypothetical protein FOPG_16189 [Fusarium oxysporum f. sp. conglutinans race 2 54008]EXL89800.1 hypothetical protein FOIG_16916 [Fusarium odoratissimum NRRL 54006]